MAAVRVYLTRMREVQRLAGRKMGTDVAVADKATRVAVYSPLAVLAVIVKLLVDRAVITDADLAAAFAAMDGTAWDDEPREPVRDP